MFGDDLSDRQLIVLTEQLDPRRMKSHEDTFLRQIQNNRTLSPKQRRWLENILEAHAVLETKVYQRDRERTIVRDLHASGWHKRGDKAPAHTPPPRETKLVGFPQVQDVYTAPPEAPFVPPLRRLGGIPAAATRSLTFDEALDEIDPCQGGGYGADPFDPYEPDF